MSEKFLHMSEKLERVLQNKLARFPRQAYRYHRVIGRASDLPVQGYNNLEARKYTAWVRRENISYLGYHRRGFWTFNGRVPQQLRYYAAIESKRNRIADDLHTTNI